MALEKELMKTVCSVCGSMCVEERMFASVYCNRRTSFVWVCVKYVCVYVC